MSSEIDRVGCLTDALAASVAFCHFNLEARVVAQTTNADGSLQPISLDVGQAEVELIEPTDENRLGGTASRVDRTFPPTKP